METHQLQYFYSTSSFSGLLSLYIMKLSYDKRKGFDKKDLTSQLKILSEPYFHGFIVACAAMKILSYNSTKPDILTSSFIDPLVHSTIEEEIEKKAQTELWKLEFEQIKKYFI